MQLLGFEPLDRLLGDAPPKGALLLRNEPGIPGEAFLHQAARHHLGVRPVIYATVNKSPARLRSTFARSGTDVSSAPLLILDAHSGLPAFGQSSAAACDPADPASFAAALASLVARYPDALVVVDSLSSLADRSSEQALAAALPTILGALSSAAASVCLFTTWPFHARAATLDQHFDAVVVLRGVERSIMRNQVMQVAKTAWAPLNTQPLLFLANDGRVAVHVPKIVVTGAPGAGKTTLIHAISPGAVSAERLGTTVALDRGQLVTDALHIELFGTPGQRRFDALLDMLLEQAAGAIVLVDATGDDLARTKEILAKVRARGIHAVVVANKQDAPGAADPVQLRTALGEAAIVPCSGQDADLARDLVLMLARDILWGGRK